MPETQNIEYKSSWHDDYLKWICGFANAQGGRIYIGKNDAETVVGLPDQKKLMEDIPNKIKNFMGITAEVNLLEENGKHFIEIIVLPYSVPISLRGRYYYRSGSVKQELTGNSLNEFLLKRTGRTGHCRIGNGLQSAKRMRRKSKQELRNARSHRRAKYEPAHVETRIYQLRSPRKRD